MKQYSTKLFVGKGTGKKGKRLESITFKYYEQDEADKLEINYHKRIFPVTMKKGDHILTDDGWVVPIWSISYNKRARLFQVRLPNGTFFVDKGLRVRNKILSTEPNDRCLGDPTKRISGNTFKQTIFATMMALTNFDYTKSFEEAYGRRLQTQNDRDLLKRLLQSKEICKNIMNKMEELYEKAGIKPESIITRVDRVLTALTEQVEQSKSAEDSIKLSQEAVSVAGVMGNWAGFEDNDNETPQIGLGMRLLSSEKKQLTKPVEENIFDEGVK